MIADVSGKGIDRGPARRLPRGALGGPDRAGTAAGGGLRPLARLLYARTSAESFATAFLAVLDPESGRLRYANAGHNPALVVRAGGEIECLRATGAPLGILPSAPYAGAEFVLAPGESWSSTPTASSKPPPPATRSSGSSGSSMPWRGIGNAA